MGRLYNQYGELVGYYHGGHVYKGRGHEYHDDAIIARIVGNSIYTGDKYCHYGYENKIGYVQSGTIYDRSGSMIGRYKDGKVYGNWKLNMIDTVENAYSKEIGHYEDGDEEGGALAALVLLINNNNTIIPSQTNYHSQTTYDMSTSLGYTGPSFDDCTGISDVFGALYAKKTLSKNKFNFIVFIMLFALVYSVSLYLVKIDKVGYHFSNPWGGNIMTMVRHVVRVLLCAVAAYSVVFSIDKAKSQLTKVTRSVFGVIWLFIRHVELKFLLWLIVVVVLSLVNLIILIFRGTGLSTSPFTMADRFMWDLFY